VSLVLDSGALVALDKNDRAMWRRLKGAWLRTDPPRSHAGVIGQVWRGQGPRQARLAQALAAIEVVPLDEPLGRAAGVLLGRARQHDVIDAALVLLAADGDDILTSDPDDLELLARALGRHVEIIPI
jgi:hypothetical protein